MMPRLMNVPARIHSLTIAQGAFVPMPQTAIDRWLVSFKLDPFVHRYAAIVISRIPAHVREDLMEDPAFHICDYEPGPGVVMQVPMRLPVRNRASRSVVLKRTLRHRSDAFVTWLIAHELAHAHLRHGGRFEGEDPEHAADALAAEWGFPKPAWEWEKSQFRMPKSE